jgi:hypothetical protein
MGRDAVTASISGQDDPGREFAFTDDDFQAIARFALSSVPALRRIWRCWTVRTPRPSTWR